MRFVFTSYSCAPEFDSPTIWLKRIAFYTGILARLSEKHSVTGVEHINFDGAIHSDGVDYIFLKETGKRVLFPYQKHRVIKKLKPDFVFINGFIFPAQIIQLRLQLGSQAKIIILHRAEKPSGGYKKALQMIADKCVSAYFFTSIEFANTWIESGIVKDKTKFYEIIQSSSIFKYRDKAAAKKTLGISADQNFLWVGRLEVNKDPLTVVNGFLQFLAHSPSATLFMIYQDDGLLTAVKDLLCRSPEYLRAVRLIGPVPHTELEVYFNACDYIISGSHYEGSGISVIEAMSCGCIPVVTGIASFRKITNNGQYGFLYNAGNIAGLVEALKRTTIINKTEMETAVRLHFQAQYSFEAIAAKTNAVVNSLFVQ
jgi:glycosyltransferase involved in cell wall biosynthesis